MIAAVSESAAASGARSATQSTLQSKLVNSHLCGLNVYESTRSTPA